MKTLRIAGRVLAALAGIGMLAACIYLLVKGRPESSVYPAIATGILGYILLIQGKRSARVTVGGIVIDIVTDDTAAFKTGIDAAGSVATNLSQEISNRTLVAAINKSTPPPIPK